MGWDDRLQRGGMSGVLKLLFCALRLAQTHLGRVRQHYVISESSHNRTEKLFCPENKCNCCLLLSLSASPVWPTPEKRRTDVQASLGPFLLGGSQADVCTKLGEDEHFKPTRCLCLNDTSDVFFGSSRLQLLLFALYERETDERE